MTVLFMTLEFCTHQELLAILHSAFHMQPLFYLQHVALHIYILPVISSINPGTLQNDLSLITQTGFFSLDSKEDMELKELHYLMHFQRDLFGESVC